MADSTPGVVTFVGIDTDTSGNTPIGVSAVNVSKWAAASSSFQVDVVIDEVDAADLISGFDATLVYDPAKINVTGINASMLLATTAGSTVANSGDAVPDSDGSFVIGISDTSANHESGEGVVVRLTLSCVGTGPALLDLNAPSHSSTKGAPLNQAHNPIPVTRDGQATIYCGYAPTFAPTTAVRMCNAMPAGFADAEVAGNPACAENLQTQAIANVTTTTTFPTGTYTADSTLTFVPNATDITPGSLITAGVKFGGVRTAGTVGVANGACNTAQTTDTVLYNVAMPNNLGDPRASTNLVYARPEGSSDRFGGWQVGSEPAPAGGTAPGTPPMAAGTSIAVQNYPAFLLDAFDPDFVPGVDDGPALPVLPLAVYGGLTQVLGVWQPTYVMQFDSAGANSLATIPAFNDTVKPVMGKPYITLVGDPAAQMPDPASTITDVCSPMTITTTLLGRDTGNTSTRASNPGTGGTYFFVQAITSQRDTDQDGIENTLDTCPTDMNGGNPIAGTGDMDGDGVDDACDFIFGAGTDQDADGVLNTGDNCPQLGNASQAQAEQAPASDDGPATDAIGDVCDSEIGPVTVIQNRSSGSATLSIAMSDSVANGRYMLRVNNVPKCFGATTAGGTDVDGDGYCAAQDAGGESGACAATVPPSCAVRHNAWSGTHPLVQTDRDSDGFADGLEAYMGTDPVQPCAMTPAPPSIAGGVSDEALDNWPLDFTDNRLPDILDVATYSSRFNKAVNAAGAGTRHDLTGNGLIDILDVSKFGTVFNQRCGADPGMPGPFSQQ